MRLMRYSIFRHSNRPVVASQLGRCELVDSLTPGEKHQRHGGIVDLDTGWYSQVISWFIYPLVNIQKTMERFTIFNG